MSPRYSLMGRAAIAHPVFLTVFSLLTSFAPKLYAQQGAPKVEVLEMKANELRQWSDFSGRITAVERVDVRPLVSGRIEQVMFSDGELVEKGQLLFVIDPRPFEAAVKQAEASLATAKARARLTGQDLQRSQELLGNKLISQSRYDESLTADDVAKAAILQAESQLLNAKLDLEYAHVVAPIAGRVGRAELTAGNIVGAGANAPLLTTIVDHKRVYADFRVDEQTYLHLAASGSESNTMPVTLSFGEGAEASSGDGTLKGKLYAFDNQLDSNSGTIRARAIFPNESGRLVPGMFANVRIGSASKRAEYVIPERAIGTNQDRKFVYVVDANNTVQYREVKLGDQIRGQRVVREGLNSGDRVVVGGLSRVRPQSTVDPVPVDNAAELAANLQ